MRYYAMYDKIGNLLCVGVGNGGTEITVQEYDAHLQVIREKSTHVINVLNDAEKIDQVPEEWREEVLRRVEDIKAQQTADIEATEADYLAALDRLGVSE